VLLLFNAAADISLFNHWELPKSLTQIKSQSGSCNYFCKFHDTVEQGQIVNLFKTRFKFLLTKFDEASLVIGTNAQRTEFLDLPEAFTKFTNSTPPTPPPFFNFV